MDGFCKEKPSRFCQYLECHVRCLLSPYRKKFSGSNCLASDFKARLVPRRYGPVSQSFFPSSVRYLAEWMVNGYPSENVWPLDLKRFGTLQSSRTFLRHRVMEVMRKSGLCGQCWLGWLRFSSLLCCLSSVIALENHLPSSWSPLWQYSLSPEEARGGLVWY